MIQPTELRIGNYIYDNNGITNYVDAINNNTICLRKNNEISHESYNEVQPIPITEDILLKCGFIKDECVNKRCKCYLIKVKNLGGDIDVPYCIEYTFRDGEKSTNFVSLPSKEIKI